MTSPVRISGARRWIYFAIGWVFFVLGALGAFLPILPTTPFMIVALWAFSRSSERFQRWLYDHPVFGPPLQRWYEFGVIPVAAKMAAVGAMAASIAYLIIFTAVPVSVLLVTGGFMAAAGWFIVSRPSEVPATRIARAGRTGDGTD